MALRKPEEAGMFQWPALGTEPPCPWDVFRQMGEGDLCYYCWMRGRVVNDTYVGSPNDLEPDTLYLLVIDADGGLLYIAGSEADAHAFLFGTSFVRVFVQ